MTHYRLWRRSGTHEAGEKVRSHEVEDEVRYHKAGEGVRLYLFAEEQVDSTRNASEDKEALIRLGRRSENSRGWGMEVERYSLGCRGGQMLLMKLGKRSVVQTRQRRMRWYTLG